MYVRYLKKIIDKFLAFVLLILVSPFLLIIIIPLLFINRGNLFFLQERPGRGEKIFRIIKFKTMNDKTDIDGKLLPDELRLTAIGRFIRRNSLDEILQLVNVLMGDMSIVGPRPLSPKYLPLYNELQRKRHNVLPGITGLAQINGRNAISWEKKFAFDVFYVENVSFKLDMKIIFLTIFKVLNRENVREGGHGEVVSFNGSN